MDSHEILSYNGIEWILKVGLDPPIRQGQTRYHFLIFLFSKEVEMTLEMSMSELVSDN